MMVSNGVQISGSGVVGKNQDNHFAFYQRRFNLLDAFLNGSFEKYCYK